MTLVVGVIVWLYVLQPGSPPLRTYWSQIADVELLDDECRSDRALPRVCIHRRKGACRIITVSLPSELAPGTVAELWRMCEGWFPVYPQLGDVPYRRQFSDPEYQPNQAPPSVDPAWQFQSKEIK